MEINEIIENYEIISMVYKGSRKNAEGVITSQYNLTKSEILKYLIVEGKRVWLNKNMSIPGKMDVLFKDELSSDNGTKEIVVEFMKNNGKLSFAPAVKPSGDVILRLCTKELIDEEKIYEEYTNNIKESLIHITPVSNLEKIFSCGEIFSPKLIEKNEINPVYITDEVSHILDFHRGTINYVKLAYSTEYDMFGTILDRIDEDLAIIKIKKDIIFDKKDSIQLSDRNSTKSEAKINSIYKIAPLLDFEKVYSMKFSGGEEDKNARQSEVLIKDSISLNYIEEIIIPHNYVVNFDKKNIKLTQGCTYSLLR